MGATNRVLGTIAATGVLASGLVSGLAVPALADTTTYNYTGTADSYTVPSFVSEVTVRVCGAGGGGTIGGTGVCLKSTFGVTSGETFGIYVGGAGSTAASFAVATGGWNGGGASGRATDTINKPGSGGGASDIRRGGSTLADRAVVAGGGGGGTTTLASINRAGGAGGIVGVDGSSGITTFSGKGGTASAGGAGGIGGNPGGAGFLGIGGAGGTSGSRSGGGGGAGYYGGGGGSTGDVNVGSGGGGSSAGPTGTSVDGPNSGDGSITITAVPVAPPTVTGIAPTTGPAAGGNSITITGTGFAAGATATIGGTVCANPIVTGTTSITCISPAGNPGAANVTVTNPDAQSSVLANAYTYVPNTQLPLLNCVTAPRVIPRRGVRQLLANRCVTNAGQPVRVWVTGFLRGDVSYWTEIRKRNGAVWIKTHGYRLKLRITWKAPATSTYSAYTLTRSYRT